MSPKLNAPPSLQKSGTPQVAVPLPSGVQEPPELPLAELNANLERIGDDLGVDVEVQACLRVSDL